VVTNAQRNGTTYGVLIIDTHGRIVARTVAQLPHIKATQTADLPLVSASNTSVYYLNGDTDIRSLSTEGSIGFVKSIADGAKSALTFAVSPDDQRIAVAVLSERADSSKDTAHGYVENLTDTSSRVDLFNNIGQAALRWPVGWHAGSIVDAVGVRNCYGGCYGNSGPISYHAVDIASGNRAVVCESTSGQSSDYYTPQGAPTPAGVACEEQQYSAASSSDTLMIVDWKGNEHQVKSVRTCCSELGLQRCFVAPDGAQLACTSTVSQSLVWVRSDGATTNSGRRYSVLGWIDATHLLVDVDSSNLGVVFVSASDGSLVEVPLAGADQVAFATALPGSL
jgi:hypothetical protein